MSIYKCISYDDEFKRIRHSHRRHFGAAFLPPSFPLVFFVCLVPQLRHPLHLLFLCGPPSSAMTSSMEPTSAEVESSRLPHREGAWWRGCLGVCVPEQYPRAHSRGERVLVAITHCSPLSCLPLDPHRSVISKEVRTGPSYQRRCTPVRHIKRCG